jgi:beta-N-acetylhexosaminidase
MRALGVAAASALALGVLTTASSCRPPAPAPPPARTPPGPAATVAPLPAATPTPSRWARETLARLTLDEKVAQMIGVRAFGLYRHPSSKESRQLRRDVEKLGVGSVCVFESEVESVPRVVNELQRLAKVPLLVSADMERGISFRVRRGAVPLPYAMAIGATRSEEAARFMGEVSAREGRALGIHWALAPVADVNSNPANPVINIRSFGEDPELVGRMVSAFIAGARGGGLLTTAKHFPGHGDTELDSHLKLASVIGDRARLDTVELPPFRRAIEAGVDSIMLGHVAVPSLDATGAPATLSPAITGLLRNPLGFQGLIVTDALEMVEVYAAWTGEAAVRAVQSGADVILLPSSAEVAVQSLVRAVKEGEITVARIDESVLRILQTKERLGLQQSRLVDAAALPRSVGRPEDVEKALAVARQSITVVRNEGGVLPFKADEPMKVLHLVLSSDPRMDGAIALGVPESELADRRIPAETIVLGAEVSDERVRDILARAPDFTHVLVSAFVRVGAFRGTTDMSESGASLLRSLAGSARRMVVVSYGSPYLLRQFAQVPAYVCAYGWAETSQRAAMSALFGEQPVTGKLPVTLPDLYPYGHGLQMARRPMILRAAQPEEAGFRPGGLAEADAVIDRALAEKAFPGGVLAVGKDGALVHLRPFGRLSYDANAAPVTANTIYDLASLTKVIVTTTAAAILVDEGRLDLNKAVSAFVPGFRGGAKDRVTVEQLLTHSAGLDWWMPLYTGPQGRQAIVQRIVASDLKYEPGTKSVYSDLGELLLGEVLERVAGEPLEAFGRRRVLEPLRMRETLFRPPRDLLPRIAPTERFPDQPRDNPRHGKLVQGEVHDENAFALGGVAAHAGLFGTAPDVARFAQMLLNGGVYDHQRIVSRATLERFTRRASVPGSTRAYGWDTPGDNNSAGSLLSPRSFGHTGFTGTSMWMDPERELFVILLTNRVHPTRENNAIREVRRAVADAVVRGLAAAPPAAQR